MANKKTKKKHTRLKQTAASKVRTVKKAVRNKLPKKKTAPKKKLAKKVGKRPALKKAEAKTKTAGKKTTGARSAGAFKRRVPTRRRSLDTEPFEPQGLRSRSAGQSGDLQGLSNIESADSESVDELIEEGNAFEADVVAGVESAGDAGEKEVRTHEVPEDDVPGEYLDKE
jgi:hypothetical protein